MQSTLTNRIRAGHYTDGTGRIAARKQVEDRSDVLDTLGCQGSATTWELTMVDANGNTVDAEDFPTLREADEAAAWWADRI